MNKAGELSTVLRHRRTAETSAGHGDGAIDPLLQTPDAMEPATRSRALARIENLRRTTGAARITVPECREEKNDEVSEGKSRRVVGRQRADRPQWRGARKSELKTLGKLDAIVIASGMGGLTAASLLAHAGKKVAVFEQHTVPGGCTHTWDLKGVPFDTGLHYIGTSSVAPGSGTRQLMDLASGGKLQWAPMAEEYDVVRFAGDGESVQEFRVPKGEDNFKQALLQRFPKEQHAIDQYFQCVHLAQGSSTGFFAMPVVKSVLWWLGPVLIPFESCLKRRFFKWSRKTAHEVIGGLTRDAELQSILEYPWGLAGKRPEELSFAAHAMMVKHYLDGASFPVGGPAEIAKTIVPEIEKHDGCKVFVRAPVSEILLDASQKRVRGVKVRGIDIEAPVVMSGIGLGATYHKLLAKAPQWHPKTPLPGMSTGHLSLFATLEGDFTAQSSNYWIFPGPDHNANVVEYEKDPVNNPFSAVFLSFPSFKDPAWSATHGDQLHTCHMVAEIKADVFKQWEDKRVRRRGDEYNQLKARFTQRLFAILEEQFPKARALVTEYELGTPCSTQYYLKSKDGASYGLDASPARFEHPACTPVQPLKGLYLAGQDALSMGVFGAHIGGVLATLAAFPRLAWTYRKAIMKL